MRIFISILAAVVAGSAAGWLVFRRLTRGLKKLSRLNKKAAGTRPERRKDMLEFYTDANCVERWRCASSFLAAKRTPVVSLSSRWTMPGRSAPPIPDRSSQ